MEYDVLVIGAGAAGMLAASASAGEGARTLLLEKNRKAGVKILMSGGTRCNITHATDKRGIIDAFGSQGHFLHSALAALSPEDVVRMVEQNGVATKVEPTGKVFPQSDRAVDVRDAFLNIVRAANVTVRLGESVTSVERAAGGFSVVSSSSTFVARRVIITTGGRSYPECGTTGEGYAWAREFGHTIVPPKPALVPLTTQPPWIPTLQGLTIPDVHVRVHVADLAISKRNALAERRSSLLFTHFGVSGPAAMDVSFAVAKQTDPKSLQLTCDFLPSLSESQLQADLETALRTNRKRSIQGILTSFAPRRLVESMLLEDIPNDRRGAEVSKRDRRQIVDRLKRAAIPLLGTLGFRKAEVTTGGVELGEVDSHTMESKLVPGLYFAGEVLDLDGPIGGYNFQAAFSTGWLAGSRAARMC